MEEAPLQLHPGKLYVGHEGTLHFAIKNTKSMPAALWMKIITIHPWGTTNAPTQFNENPSNSFLVALEKKSVDNKSHPNSPGGILCPTIP